MVSVSASGLEKNPGWKLNTKILNRAIQAFVYGDLFMRVLFATRPYEAVKGSANELYEKWNTKVKADITQGKNYKKNLYDIVKAFDELELTDEKKPKVGVVGEILVKFHPTANNDIVGLLEKEGAEAVVPDLLGFGLYSAYNAVQKHKYLGMGAMGSLKGKAVIELLEYYRKPMVNALKKSERFNAPERIEKLGEFAEPIVSLCNQTGEGWFLTGEMMELIHTGVSNIVCTQPFACLPNHVVGKGVIKEIKRINQLSNIVAIDYDPGASEVNQLNRIKLMLAAAHKNLDKAQEKESEEDFTTEHVLEVYNNTAHGVNL